MSKKDTQQQKVSMSLMFRGKEIFKPLNTGRIDEKVACVREWVANIFFYTKGDTTVMIDAGYNYYERKRFTDRPKLSYCLFQSLQKGNLAANM